MSQISLFFWFSPRLSTSISICAVEKVCNAFLSLGATVLCLGGSRDGGSDELWPRHFFLDMLDLCTCCTLADAAGHQFSIFGGWEHEPTEVCGVLETGDAVLLWLIMANFCCLCLSIVSVTCLGIWPITCVNQWGIGWY